MPLIDHDLRDIVKDDVLKALNCICKSSVKFIGHNIKYDYLLFRRNNINIYAESLCFDTMLASYESHGEPDLLKLQYLVESKLGNKNQVLFPTRYKRQDLLRFAF